MFYSHTFLARKGPLGTVWCAAHLQHKLKKTHYISTNVPSTVERIMYPEVPIALRMSGHLLLGVVRIYSKQVDYLYEDCNVIRITINRVFTSVNANLLDDTTHATFHSVTLPERFDLDSLKLDDYYKDWGEDSHLKSKSEITLADQIPTGQDPFIVISFDEHELRAPSPVQDNSGTGPVPMEEDVPPTVEDGPTAGFEDISPNDNQLGDGDRNVSSSSPQGLRSTEIMRDARRNNSPILPNRADPDEVLEEQINKDILEDNDRNVGSSSPQGSRSIEIMRDARHNNSPILPDRADPDEDLEEQINKDMEMPPPGIVEEVLPEAGPSSPRNHGGQHSFGGVDSPMHFDHSSPEMEIQRSPTVAQPKARRRKRKQPFDKSTALSNEHMRNMLNDTRDIHRAKRNCPCSSLAIWKLQNRLRLKKDGIFIKPFTTGACADLHDIYKEDAVSSKPQLVITERIDQEASFDQEIEIMRNNEGASPERQMPPFSTAMPSQNERSYFTPEKSHFGFQSEGLETTDVDDIFPTPGKDMGASPGDIDWGIRTPDTFFQEDHTPLSNIPEPVASAGELGFLEQDDISPPGSQDTPESDFFTKNQGTPQGQALSSRARAVAQYLKRQSSTTPTSGSSDDPPGDLSLFKILEGKSRKVSARMFFETLVLKNCGLVDVNQVNAYDDITLKVTPKLLKEQLSC